MHLSILRQRYPDEARKEVLPELRVEELLDKTVLEMSGGEERRAEMAVAWARKPSVLIADEPLAGLAPKDQEVVAGVIRSMARDGTGVILSGHDVRPLLELADEIVWMVAGTTHGLGSSDEARAHDQFRKEYLGPAF
jgi:ABC-type lipopolysaccharide export system ATPase subunit